MSLHAKYRMHDRVFDPAMQTYGLVTEIPDGADRARISRDRKNCVGLSARSGLRRLEIYNADQAALEEVSHLSQLDVLDLGWPVVANDLRPLTSLRELSILTIDSPRKITDFSPIADLPALTHLVITNAKHLGTLDWLRPLKDRLVVLGIEGSMTGNQDIPSLKPLNGFRVEALFLTSTKLLDGDLSPIATMPNIRLLETAMTAPKAAFMALKASKPALECDWFNEAKWAGMRDPRPRKQS